MTQNSFTCSAREWYFARYLSVVNGSDRGKKNRALLGCLVFPAVSIFMLLIYFLLSLLWTNDGGFVWIKDWAIAAGILAAAIVVVPKVVKAGSFRMPEPSERVTFVVTSDEGISINTNNNQDPKILPFFLWESIKEVKIDRCKITDYYYGGSGVFDNISSTGINRAVARLNSIYPGETPEVAKLIYPDRFSVLLNVSSPLKRVKDAIVPIPPSWLTNGYFIKLLQDIRHYTGLEITAYDEEADLLFRNWRDTLR